MRPCIVIWDGSDEAMTQHTITKVSRRTVIGVLAGFGAGSVLVACNGGAHVTTAPTRVSVVACEGFWGSIVEQIGDTRVSVMNIIADPNIDPHDYEPKTSDARLFAGARYVVVNGAGYDPWAAKLLAANPVAGRRVLMVADLFGKKDGDNPHLWYSPDYVLQTTDRITADLQALDPDGASFYDAQRTQFKNVALKPYTDAITTIKGRFAGTAVGASESIFVYLADALGLNLITPHGFLNAISGSSDPTARDKATADAQITGKQIAVYVYNSQNTTPDVNAQRDKAQASGIPIVAITETPDTPTQSLQDWQTAQLGALITALAQATGN